MPVFNSSVNPNSEYELSPTDPLQQRPISEVNLGEIDSNDYEVGNAFARGIDQTQASLYAAANALGEATGFDAVAKWGLEGFERNMAEVRENPPAIRDWDDVDDLADFGEYVLERLGEQAPQLLGDIGTLIAGTAVGGVGGVAAVAARRTALAQLGKGVKRKVGDKAMINALAKAKGQKIGGTVAVGGSMVAQGIGETQGQFIDRGIEAPGDAIIAGVLKGGLDKIGFDRLMGLANKTGKSPVGLIKEVGMLAGVESGTEALQTVVDHIAIKANDDTFDPFSIESLKEIREAMIVGGLVGGITGGTVSGANRIMDRRADRATDVAQDLPLPESQETIDAQARAMADPTSTKDSMQVTHGSPMPTDLPEGTQVVEAQNGPVFTTNPEKAQRLRDSDGGQQVVGEILYGEANGKEGTDGTTVVARDAQGNPVSEVLTSAEDLGNTFETGEDLAPEGGSVEVLTGEEVLEQRLKRIREIETQYNQAAPAPEQEYQTDAIETQDESLLGDELSLDDPAQSQATFGEDTDDFEALQDLSSPEQDVETGMISDIFTDVEAENSSLQEEVISQAKIFSDGAKIYAKPNAMWEKADQLNELDPTHKHETVTFAGQLTPEQVTQLEAQGVPVKFSEFHGQHVVPIPQSGLVGDVRKYERAVKEMKGEIEVGQRNFPFGQTRIDRTPREFKNENQDKVMEVLAERQPNFEHKAVFSRDGFFQIESTPIADQLAPDARVISNGSIGGGQATETRTALGLNDAESKGKREIRNRKTYNNVELEFEDGERVSYRVADLVSMGKDLNQTSEDKDARTDNRRIYDGLLSGLTELALQGARFSKRRAKKDMGELSVLIGPNTRVLNDMTARELDALIADESRLVARESRINSELDKAFAVEDRDAISALLLERETITRTLKKMDKAGEKGRSFKGEGSLLADDGHTTTSPDHREVGYDVFYTRTAEKDEKGKTIGVNQQVKKEGNLSPEDPAQLDKERDGDQEARDSISSIPDTSKKGAPVKDVQGDYDAKVKQIEESDLTDSAKEEAIAKAKEEAKVSLREPVRKEVVRLPTAAELLKFGITPETFRQGKAAIDEGNGPKFTLAKNKVNQFLRGIDPTYDGKTFKGLEVTVVEKPDGIIDPALIDPDKPIFGFISTPDADGRRKLVIITEPHQSIDPKHENSIEATLRHEVLAHMGLAQLVDPETKAQILNSIRGSRRFLKEGWNYVDANYDGKPEQLKAEEVLAYYAERLPQDLPAWNKIMDMFVKALKKIGFLKARMTRSDLNDLLNEFNEKYKATNGATKADTEEKRKTLKDVFRPGDIAYLRKKGFALLQDIRKNPMKYPSTAFFSRDGILRDISKPLADLLFKPTNTLSGTTDYTSRVDNMLKEWHDRLETIMKPHSEDEQTKAIEQLAAELPDRQLSPLAKKIRKYLTEDFHGYMSADGVMPLMKDKLIKNYFPRLYNNSEIQARQTEFLGLLQKHGVADPEGTMAGLLQLQEQSLFKPTDYVAHITKISQERMIRDPKLIRAMVEADFLNSNPAQTLNSYLHSTVKRAEFERMFGGYSTIIGYKSPYEISQIKDEDIREMYKANNKKILSKFVLKNELLPAEHKHLQDLMFEIQAELAKFKAIPSNKRTPRDIEKLAELARLEQTVIEEFEPSLRGVLRKFQERGIIRKESGSITNGTAHFAFYDNEMVLKDFIDNDADVNNHLSKISRGLEGAEAKEAIRREKLRIKRIVMQSIESEPVDRDSTLYNVLGEIRAFESLRVLLFSGVASFPESASVVGRLNGQLPMKEIGAIIKDVVTHYKDHASYAKDIGAIIEGMSIAMQQDLMGAGSEPGNGSFNMFRNALPAMFKWNGNNAVVNFTTVFASVAGKQAFIKSVRDMGPADIRFLESLGTDSESVRAWIDAGSPSIGDAIGTPHEAQTRSAVNGLNRFIEEAILRPKPSDRTTWSDHPIGGLIFHLKSFMYKFQRNVVQGTYRELKQRYKFQDASHAETLAWTLVTFSAFMFMAAVSDELRERLKSFGEKGSYEGAYGKVDKMVETWFSRTGFDAIPWIDLVLKDPSIRNTAFTAGPTFSHIHMLLNDARGDKDATKKILKSVPVFSQHPELRKKIYEFYE